MSLHYLGKHEPGNCAFSVCHRHVSSPGECGWLCACGKARGRHFEHLQLTGSVQRGGIVNHHSIAYSQTLSNISAKNYRNRLMWVESIVCNISVVFFGTQCILVCLSAKQLESINRRRHDNDPVTCMHAEAHHFTCTNTPF